jgi:ATP-dependent Clp protease protease subunit
MKLTRESIDRFYDYDLHVETRTIYLGDTTESGEIDPELASKVVKSLHVLQSINKEAIRVLMNTNGGCWHDGLAIYDMLQGSECHITIEVIGAAMSMGAIVLQAADERVIHPNGVLMLHNGSVAMDSEAKTFENWAQFSKRSRHKAYAIFAGRTGKTVKYWEKVCSSDYILDAKDALKEGLVDRIVGEPVSV